MFHCVPEPACFQHWLLSQDVSIAQQASAIVTIVSPSRALHCCAAAAGFWNE